MRTTSSRKGAVALARVVASFVLAASFIAACSNGSGARATPASGNEVQADGGQWDLLAIEANEVERFETFAQMGQIADVVLIAQATKVAGVRRVGPEGDEGIDLAQVHFEVIRAISDWEEGAILVEFLVPTPEAMDALEKQVAGLPPTVLALRDKAGREAGFYRLVNSQSLWTEQPGGGVVAPLGDELQLQKLASEVAKVESLEDLGDHLETARRDCDPECGWTQAEPNR